MNYKDYEMTKDSSVGLFVGTYKKYNEGNLAGAWIDIESVSDADEFFEVCRNLHSDEENPEFMFQDFEGFPENMYSECMGEDEIDKLIEFAQLDADEREMVYDYYEVCGAFDDISDIKDKCVGHYNDWADFCDQSAIDMFDGFEARCDSEYTCKGAADMVETLRNYFD